MAGHDKVSSLNDTKGPVTDEVFAKAKKYLKNGWNFSTVASLLNVCQSELRRAYKIEVGHEYHEYDESAGAKRVGTINHSQFIPVKTRYTNIGRSEYE